MSRPRPAHTLVVLVAVVAGCPRGPGRPAPAVGTLRPDGDERVRITLLSTNDLHGQLEPLLRLTAEPSPRAVRLGGAEALAATIRELYDQNGRGTVLLDAGDFMQGSMLSNHFEGLPVRELYALLRYDAVAIGNHEFDYGPAGVPDPPGAPRGDVRGALRAWARLAPFPLLTANISDAAGQPLRLPNLRPSQMVERQGVRIGIVGLTTPRTAETTMPAYVQDLRFAPLLDAARREARALRAAGAAVVVLLAHADGSCRSMDPASCRGELFDMVRGLEPGLVDAVVAGHSHHCICHRVNGVFVIEACSQGTIVGQLELVVDRAARRVVAATAPRFREVCREVFTDTGGCDVDGRGPLVPNPLLARQRQVTDEVRRLLARYRSEIAPTAARVYGEAARPLRHRFDGRSEVGALIAAALLEVVPGTDFSIVNSGSIRADLPAGKITYGRLFDAFPFDNHLATVRLRGDQLRALLERILARAFGVVVVGGLRLRLRQRQRCDERRTLVAVTDAQGRSLDARRRYTLVMNDFLLAGGDGLGPVLDAIPAMHKRVYADRLLRDELGKFLLRHPGPINTAAAPVLPPDRPTVLLEGDSCRPDRVEARPLCH